MVLDFDTEIEIILYDLNRIVSIEPFLLKIEYFIQFYNL